MIWIRLCFLGAPAMVLSRGKEAFLSNQDVNFYLTTVHYCTVFFASVEE
jgi:hypothetical protein